MAAAPVEVDNDALLALQLQEEENSQAQGLQFEVKETDAELRARLAAEEAASLALVDGLVGKVGPAQPEAQPDSAFSAPKLEPVDFFSQLPRNDGDKRAIALFSDQIARLQRTYSAEEFRAISILIDTALKDMGGKPYRYSLSSVYNALDSAAKITAVLPKNSQNRQITFATIFSARLDGLSYMPRQIHINSPAALRKLGIESERLFQLNIAMQQVSLQALNVHQFSQTGPIRAACAYAQQLDQEYNLSRAADINIILREILACKDAICRRLEEDAARADAVPERKGGPTSAQIAAGHKADIQVLANVTRVCDNIGKNPGVDGETRVAMADIVSRVWFLVKYQELSTYAAQEDVVRNLSINIEDGGGCIPGIITRIMVPYVLNILNLIQHMLYNLIEIPKSRTNEPLEPTFVPPPPMTPAYAAKSGQPAAAAARAQIEAAKKDAAQSAKLEIAMKLREEYIDLMAKFGPLPQLKEEILRIHRGTLSKYKEAALDAEIKRETAKIKVLQDKLNAKKPGPG